jgi:probable phosphoglycerate mutase
MQTDLLLIRHGQTASNRAHRIQGWSSDPLTALGQQQAQYVAERLTTYPISALYTSPLARTQETANIIGNAINQIPILLDGLREVDTGAVSGQSILYFLQRYPKLALAWFRDKANYAFPEGEQLSVFYQRVCSSLNWIRDQHPNQTVAVVSHGGSISAYLSLLLNGYSSNRLSWRLRNCSICHVRWQDQQSAQVIAYNDVAHLPKKYD